MSSMFAFDDCSILHLCKVKIPNAYIKLLGKPSLEHKNFYTLESFQNKLKSKGINKYRFIPSTIEGNIISFADELIQKDKINIHLLPHAFKSEILNELEAFKNSVNYDFEVIKKSEDFEDVKSMFVDNEKELKKEKNIPEDDDCKIIKGYFEYDSEDSKTIISEDEHFWGYEDLIKEKFQIIVIEEWNCDKVKI